MAKNLSLLFPDKTYLDIPEGFFMQIGFPMEKLSDMELTNHLLRWSAFLDREDELEERLDLIQLEASAKQQELEQFMALEPDDALWIS